MTTSRSDRQAAVKHFQRFTARFGSGAGLCYFSLGLSLEGAAKLHGTALGNRLLKHDPADEVTAWAAAGLFGKTVTFWAAQVSTGGAPAADRQERGFSYWKLSTLATWAAADCPGRAGRTNPELLAEIGGTGQEPRLTDRERNLGRNLALVANDISLPSRS